MHSLKYWMNVCWFVDCLTFYCYRKYRKRCDFNWFKSQWLLFYTYIYTHIRHHMYTLILQFAVSFDNKFLENCFICFGNRRAAVRMLINDLYRFSSQIRLQQSQEIPTLSHRWSMNFRLSLTRLLFVSL